MTRRLTGAKLLDSPTRTVDTLYARLIDDIRNDIVRIPQFLTAARAVLDMDKRRDQSLRYVSVLTPAEHGNAVARMGENLLIVRLPIADRARDCLPVRA